MTTSEYIKGRENELDGIKSFRVYSTSPERVDPKRIDSDIDYARILYSSSFRRLQGKMQLLIPKSVNFHRNRLTHSLEVAQISRSLAKRLDLADTLTVQSCALAHDLGNPPFGHKGEAVLSKCSNTSHYEGNAQTFRILNHLEEKHYEYNGLNLTLRTLLGIVKYPYKLSDNPKKYLYNEDYALVEDWKTQYSLKLKTIDCEIMDLADEIAYAAHDLEDALRMKFFTIDELMHEFKNSEFNDSFSVFQKLVENAKAYAMKAKAYKTSEEYSILFKKELTSQIVNALVTDIDVISNEEGNFELGYKQYKYLAFGLKKLTFKAIKRSPDVLQYEILGEKVINGLYNMYMDKVFNKDLELLPAEYKDPENWERTVLDYIGGMMDEYAISQYTKYYGESSLSKIYEVAA